MYCYDLFVVNNRNLEWRKNNGWKMEWKSGNEGESRKSGDEWTLEELTDTEQEKMLGIYEY